MSWLADYFTECVATESLGVVALRSPTGWGKTTEVEDLYVALAGMQPDPRFWPAGLDSKSRKSVRPVSPLRPAAGARMPFLWLGWRAELRDDGWPRFAGYDLDAQLSQLVEPVAEAIAGDARLWRDRAWSVLKAATSTTAVTLFPVGETVRMLKELQHIATELVELVPELLGETQRVGTRTERALRAGGGSTIVTDGSAQARDQAEWAGFILSAVSHVLPTVVAVEDAQLLDDHSVAMLSAWVRSELPTGLLVLTVATDRPGPAGEWARWYEELQRTEAISVVDLAPVPDDELEQAALERLREDHPGSRINQQLLTELVTLAAGNLLSLHTLLDQPVVITAMMNGDLAALHQAAAAGPASDTGLLAAFDRLDRPTRQALAVLALHGQATSTDWLDAGFRVGLDTVTDQTEALRRAQTCGWCEPTTEDAIGFTDAASHRTVLARMPTLLTAERQLAILQRLYIVVDAIRSTSRWSRIPVEIKQNAIEALLSRDGITAPDQIADLAVELDNIYTDTGQNPRRRELLQYLHTRLPDVSRPVADSLMLTIASSHLDLGDHASAIALFRTAHALLCADAPKGQDHPDTLIAQHNLAAAHLAAGQLDEAIATYRDLLNRRLRTLPPHDRHIRVTRRDLAAAYEERGRHAEARDVLTVLHTDNIATLGPDHAETIHDELRLLDASRDAGASLAAVAGLTKLLIHAARCLGEQDPIIDSIASSLARAHAHAGHLASAITIAGRVLSGRLIRLGAEHSSTLTNRNNLASWRGEAGDTASAITEFKNLLTDRLRVLGPDHPDTLATRSNLAYWRGRVGDTASAITEFENLLTDQLRVLGPDHPDTLTTRSNLAYWRGEAGDTASAITEYQTLLTDLFRVLGPDHPWTLTTRSNLAYWRAEAGDNRGAITEFENLLTDQLRVLGPDHPDTLNTRHNIAGWRGRAGDNKGAITEFENLLADRLRVLGPDHPDTLNTRNSIAGSHGRAGDIKGAITELENLLADRLRVLGPDHPDTLATRSNIASWRLEAGDIKGAITELENLLTDQLRVLGPDHPDTLATRSNLARLVGD